MAINKVVNRKTSSHGAMRNVIEYVLRDEKVKEGFLEITGPFAAEQINYDTIYRAWLEEKRLWEKDSGRMYAHNIISFHAVEKVTPEEVLEIGKAFADRFFSGFQCVITVHQDKEHLHCHIVTNSVSFLDGHKLHQTKRDLARQKEFTNELCRERGLTVAEKGKHFDGSRIEPEEVISWKKDKYQAMLNDDGQTKKSYLMDCAAAVLDAKERSASREEFIECLERSGWKTTWTENKKHITFEDHDGHKIRNSNLEKTFHLDLGKEVLLREFERQKTERERYERTARERDSYIRELDHIGSGADLKTEGRDIGSQIAASAERVRGSEASVRDSEKGRSDSERERRQSEAERRDREVKRGDQSFKQERSGIERKQKDPGLSR